MIEFEGVSKRYVSDRVPGDWVLRDVSLVIPTGASVGVVGGKGVGKSTLLRLISGDELPTQGRIDRNERVATPTKYQQNLQRLLSGRQNAKFICRINGHADEMPARMAAIEDVAGLGAKFDRPVGTYTAVMRSRLSFALSMAFNFDLYVSDGFSFAGETGFRDRAAADVALKKLSEHSGLIMSAQGAGGDETLRRFCKAGIWLRDGKAQWFDRIDDAIAAFRAGQKDKQPVETTSRADDSPPQPMRAVFDNMKRMQRSLVALNRGLRGETVVVGAKDVPLFIRVAAAVGMELVPRDQVADSGCQLAEGVVPVLLENGQGGQGIEYYDLNSQCEISSSSP